MWVIFFKYGQCFLLKTYLPENMGYYIQPIKKEWKSKNNSYFLLWAQNKFNVLCMLNLHHVSGGSTR